MMIKRVEKYFGGGQMFFCGSSDSSASQHLPTPPKLPNRCIGVSYNIPSNFKPKYWQKNFILEENQNMH